MSDDPENRSMKINFAPDVNAGHLLTVLSILGGLAGVTWTFAGDVRDTTRDFKEFRPAIEKRLEDMRRETQANHEATQHSIANIPNMAAALIQMDRSIEQISKRVDTLDSRVSAQSDRITTVLQEQNRRATIDRFTPGAH